MPVALHASQDARTHGDMDNAPSLQHIVSTVQQLTDLDLAALLCFVADQHCCIINVDEHLLPDVATELELVLDPM